MQDLTIPVITIDGGVATGKGTVAKLLALHYKYHKLDSGVLYRALGVVCHRKNIHNLSEQVHAANTLNLRIDSTDKVFLDEVDETEIIRTQGSELAASIAQIPEIRMALRNRQVSMRKPPGLIAEGRDQGFIFETPYRYFFTVDPQIAADRRVKQHREAGRDLRYEDVYKSIVERDKEDTHRTCDPLRCHPGAHVIDTTRLSAVDVMLRIINHVHAKKIQLL
ncbi:MAG: (d)CMP kinase [Patescibacteria group bacterium]